jgi:putative sporulation protein YyaC
MKYIDSSLNNSTNMLIASLKEQLASIDKAYDEICVACIGTDRSTGDSLGPLVGYKLSNSNIKVIGTLDAPLHAQNLSDFNNSLSDKTLVIAVDACLGRMEHVGYISVKQGSIKPGSGVDKDLPPIGDISVTGIVNFGGFMDFLVLQNTRLSVVMKMADIISCGIAAALS